MRQGVRLAASPDRHDERVGDKLGLELFRVEQREALEERRHSHRLAGRHRPLPARSGHEVGGHNQLTLSLIRQ